MSICGKCQFVENKKVELWDQLLEEPDLWYQRFLQFYLHETRKTPKVEIAYLNFVEAECIKGRDRLLKQWLKTCIVPKEWYEKAALYKWEERLAAYNKSIQKFLRQEETTQLKNLTAVRAKFFEMGLKRGEILQEQFIKNYGNPDFVYEKTSDYLNVVRSSIMLTEDNEKNIAGYAASKGLHEILEEKEKQQKQQLNSSLDVFPTTNMGFTLPTTKELNNTPKNSKQK